MLQELIYCNNLNGTVVAIDSDEYEYNQVNIENSITYCGFYKKADYLSVDDFIKNEDLDDTANIVYCSIWTDPRDTVKGNICYDLGGFVKLHKWCRLVVNLDVVDNEDVGSKKMKKVLKNVPPVFELYRTYYPSDVIFEELDTARLRIYQAGQCDISKNLKKT